MLDAQAEDMAMVVLIVTSFTVPIVGDIDILWKHVRIWSANIEVHLQHWLSRRKT